MDIRKNIEFENNYQFIMKWKELLSEGEEPPFDIVIPDKGTLKNCTVVPTHLGYDVNYDEFIPED